MKAPFEYNARIFSNSSQGGRKYQEDTFCIAYQQKRKFVDRNQDNHVSNLDQRTNEDSEKADATGCSGDFQDELDFIYVGIFDGHGGKEAALFTRENLLRNIISQREFWSYDDQLILEAIRKGFLITHDQMTRDVVNWPRTSSGLYSTAGTTASICFIMNNKYYTGHVGDSKIVLGKKNRETGMWIPHSLTVDHKPECPVERKRIYAAGGEVMTKSGVERVVWYRPKYGHQGPVRRSTSFDRIPFLAVARSLGDLWSYNPDNDVYVVSPEPDVEVVPINPDEDKCLILASDGLWNVLLEHECIRMVQEIEEPYEVERDLLNLLNYSNKGTMSMCHDDPTNPSQALVNFGVQRWLSSRLRADNTSVVTVLLDHRGPTQSKAGVKLDSMSLTDEQVETLVSPTILPMETRPCEYLISPNHRPNPAKNAEGWLLGTNFENMPSIPHPPIISSVTNMVVSNESSSMEKLVYMSNSMQSVEQPASTLFPCPTESHVAKFDHRITSDCVSQLQLYVNELPKSSFRTLTDALRINGNHHHKIINGVKVYRDYDENELEDDENSCEANYGAKKYRDECISVTEELVDGHCNGYNSSVLNDLTEMKIWSKTNDSEERIIEPKKPAPVLKKSTSLHSFTATRHAKERKSFFKRLGSVRAITRKRKLSGISGSPPAKHLRSSRWSRGKLMPTNNVCRRWREIAANFMTRSRLRTKKST